MRLFLFILPLSVLFSCCNPDQQQTGTDSDTLIYEIEPAQTKSLSVRAQLKGIPNPQKLELELQLSNLAEEELQVKEIIISTPEGLHSTPVNFNQKALTLSADRDTSLSYTFQPVNDPVLYKNTEMPGILKPRYTLSIVYILKGKKDARAIDLKAKLPNGKYQQYEEEYQIPVTAYRFNTTSQFSKIQQQYLEGLNLPGTTPFVHLSDQEIAVSGLNFRLQSYQKRDSLYAKILLVNHSDFPLKIDTTQLGFVYDGSKGSQNNVILNKVTGSKEEYDILKKGDRMLISFRRFSKDQNHPKITISLKNSFILPTGKSLFYDDLEIVKVVAK